LKIKWITGTLCAAVLATASIAGSVELNTSLEKESYSLGASMGNYARNQMSRHARLGIKTDVNLVIEGFLDALKGKQKLSDEEVLVQLNNRAEKLNKLEAERKKKILEKNLKEGKNFQEKNKKRKGVKVTKSGLQYEVLRPGTGRKPKLEDVVVINYRASLPNGKVFDDTYKRKMPAHLELISVIDGLSEGLQLMKEGAKYRFVIPEKLAYGHADMQGVPAGSTVIFEVELVKVLRPGGKSYDENSSRPVKNSK